MGSRSFIKLHMRSPWTNRRPSSNDVPPILGTAWSTRSDKFRWRNPMLVQDHQCQLLIRVGQHAGVVSSLVYVWLGVDVLPNDNKNDVNCRNECVAKQTKLFLNCSYLQPNHSKNATIFSSIKDVCPNHDLQAFPWYETKFCLKFKWRPKKGHYFETVPNSFILVVKFRWRLKF